MTYEQNERYFVAKGSKIILDAPRCEIYVPDQYFDAKLAVQDGEIFDLLFIAKYRIVPEGATDIAKVPLSEFAIPTMLLTRPDEVKRAEMNLYGTNERFTVFVYYRGAELIYNSEIVKNPTSVERFVTQWTEGKIRLNYGSEVNDVVNKVQKIHDSKLNVHQSVQQIVSSAVYRSISDLSVLARFVAKPDADNSKIIRGINMRESSAFTSTLAGVGFEDVKSMLTVADNRDDRKNPAPLTNIEKVIKGIRIRPEQMDESEQ
jgi:hypothetical protein